MKGRTAGPHEFWRLTCDLNTYRRSAQHARQDTPWNAFTADGKALVCTVWVDLIVDVPDPQEDGIRRFVRAGGRTKRWRGLAVQHGAQARDNLQRAIEYKLPVFGFEAEPNAAALKNGDRSVKHFYLDRAHQMKAWIGLSLHDLEQRLGIDAAFRQHHGPDAEDPNQPSTLFELVPSTMAVPGGLDAEEGRAEPAGEEAEEDEEAEIGQAFEANRTTDEYARMALPMCIDPLKTCSGVTVERKTP